MDDHANNVARNIMREVIQDVEFLDIHEMSLDYVDEQDLDIDTDEFTDAVANEVARLQRKLYADI